MSSRNFGRTNFSSSWLYEPVSLLSFQPGRGIGLRGDATRAPTQGPKTADRRVFHPPLHSQLFHLLLRDWHESGKSQGVWGTESPNFSGLQGVNVKHSADLFCCLLDGFIRSFGALPHKQPSIRIDIHRLPEATYACIAREKPFKRTPLLSQRFILSNPAPTRMFLTNNYLQTVFRFA